MIKCKLLPIKRTNLFPMEMVVTYPVIQAKFLLWHVLGSLPLGDGPFQVRLEGGVPVSNRPLNALRRICDLPLSSKSRKIKCRFIAACRISTPNRIPIRIHPLSDSNITPT